jgi:hypothetical protein
VHEHGACVAQRYWVKLYDVYRLKCRAQRNKIKPDRRSHAVTRSGSTRARRDSDASQSELKRGIPDLPISFEIRQRCSAREPAPSQPRES